MSATDPSSATSGVARVDLRDLDSLWFQVAGTRCNLTCHHCFISCSPKNHNFGFLSLEQVRYWLDQSVAWGVRDYYFTGGEPFLNPDMVEILVETLKHGPATVLTNGTVFKPEWLDRLSQAASGSRYSLEFRVSIDGFNPQTNDPIRGDGTFDRALKGVVLLVKYGFLPIVTAARTWPEEEEPEVVEKFVQVLRKAGCSRPRLKLLPRLKMGAEEDRTEGYRLDERVTPEMLEDADLGSFLCSNSRIVTDRGVHVCPLLIDHPSSLMGSSLDEANRPFDITHGACWTCYQFGAICSNSTAYNIERPATPPQ